MDINYITIIICVLGMLYALFRFNNYISPLFIFNFVWLITIILLKIPKSFVIDEPSSEVLWIVLTGIIGFNSYTIISDIVLKNKKVVFKYNSNSYLTYFYNSPPEKWIKIISTCVVMYSTFCALESIVQLINGTSMDTLRNVYFEKGNSFDSYIAQPFQYLVIIFSLNAIFSKKKNPYIIMCGFLTILLKVLDSGGRFIILNTGYMLIGLIFIKRHNISLTKKQKKMFMRVIILLVMGVLIITNVRTSEVAENVMYSNIVEKIIFTVMNYFSTSLVHLSKILSKYDIKGTTYGANFVAGFLDPLFVGIGYTHLVDYPQILQVIGEYCTETIKVGPNLYFNAFISIFGYFYIDGGYVGVFLEAALLNMIGTKFYKSMNIRKCDWLSVTFYILYIVLLFNASTRWFMYSASFALVFLYAKICSRKSVYKKEV